MKYSEAEDDLLYLLSFSDSADQISFCINSLLHQGVLNFSVTGCAEWKNILAMINGSHTGWNEMGGGGERN